MTTKEPVTMSGWYEVDGGVQRFDWRDGKLCAGQVVASWAHVPENPLDDSGCSAWRAEQDELAER